MPSGRTGLTTLHAPLTPNLAPGGAAITGAGDSRHARSWERGVEPEQTFEITVVVE
jgi:hypothetical protein